MDTDAYIQNLLDGEPLRVPVFRRILQTLQLPPGSRGLDAGCGVGLGAQLLAEAIGPEGRVTGLDILPEMLRFGEKLAADAGYAGRIDFKQGDVTASLPFDDASFDWVWSLDCVGYVGDLAQVLHELMRVVRPGGRIIILTWTGQQLLPGYTQLETRLNATCSSYIPVLESLPPEAHFLRAPHIFQQVGLQGVRVQTFMGEMQAPLTEGERRALLSLFCMLWPEPQPATAPEDWQTYLHMTTPGSPAFILDLPVYYAFFTHTAVMGRVSG